MYLFLFSFFALYFAAPTNFMDGARWVNEQGYSNCVELFNEDTRVVLEPNAGGRVLVYAFKGVNVLYQDTAQNGWTTATSQRPPNKHLSAGRFDIGPSKIKPNTDIFFFGRWKAEITSPRSARLTSRLDTATSLQVIREFKLAKNGSHLSCTQTIINHSKAPLRLCHWSRTFVEGDGICVLPVRGANRFPKKYVLYNENNTIDFQPNEPNVIEQDGLLAIVAPPTRPKFEMDVSEGWIAYLTKTNRLFVKKFALYPDKVYGEMTAANTSIWYNGRQMCEIEPIGPWEWVAPGKKLSFSEDWYLQEFTFPRSKTWQSEKLRNAVKNSN